MKFFQSKKQNFQIFWKQKLIIFANSLNPSFPIPPSFSSSLSKEHLSQKAHYLSIFVEFFLENLYPIWTRVPETSLIIAKVMQKLFWMNSQPIRNSERKNCSINWLSNRTNTFIMKHKDVKNKETERRQRQRDVNDIVRLLII